MKKGNTYPNARCRWVNGIPHYPHNGPPVWARLKDMVVGYIGEVLGVPFPFTVTEDDCTDSVWSYWPEFSAVVYHGTWDNGNQSGTWEWIEGFEDGTGLWRDVFNIRYTDLLGVHKLTLTGTPTDGAQWAYHELSQRNVNTEFAFNLPWVPAGNVTIIAETYAQIRARGRDSDDTSPLDWFYPGPP